MSNQFFPTIWRMSSVEGVRAFSSEPAQHEDPHLGALQAEGAGQPPGGDPRLFFHPGFEPAHVCLSVRYWRQP
jgi:hypothetical protein